VISLHLLFTLSAFAAPPVEVRTQEARELVQPEPDDAKGGFTAIAFVQSRLTTSSIETNSPFLDSQVVGRLGGTNGTAVTGASRADFAEYRTNGFFRWAPKVLDGRAALNAAFEVDFVHGDASYDSRGNAGGAFGADQVNLQTRRLNASFEPRLPLGHELTAVVGLQFVADGVYDPAKARPDDLFRTGGGLRFFGSEAAGASLYGRWNDSSGEKIRYKLGAYKLWEQGVSAADDVSLFMADAQVVPAHVWSIRDRSGGRAGPLGVGASSQLSELQGGPRLDFRLDPADPAPPVSADLFWYAADVGYNHALTQGPVGVRSTVVLNNSWFYAESVPDDNGIGWMADVEARWRYARGDGSVARAEATFVTDDNPAVQGYGGVLTGNSYGIVGATWATHDTFLLFPDPGGINRQVAVVYDVSNQGQGLVALTGSLGYDAVPNKVNVRVGGGQAWTQGFNRQGTELNARVNVRPLPFLNTGAAAAAVFDTDQPLIPWTAFGYLEWVVF
jgi:hypothetical protein